MKYFLGKSNKDSLLARQAFLYDVFKLWFIPYDHGDYLELTSMPTTAIDVCFIIGHISEVNSILVNNTINEDNIVLVTCDFHLSINHLENKNIFLPLTNAGNRFCHYVNGQDYGFDFNITQSEIVLYNYSKYNLSPLEMIEKSFNKLRESGENI